MTEPERKRLLDFLDDPERDEEREILEAPPVPLSPALEARLVEAALREAAPAAAASGPAEIPTVPSRADDAPATDELAARRARGRRIPWSWLGGLAVAAATVLVVRSTSSPSELPAFAVEGRGRATNLGDDPAPSGDEIRLAAGASLELLVRPALPAPADTDVRAYLRQGDTHLRWNIQPERTRVNGFRLLLPFAQIPDLRPGRSEAIFILAHKDHMPSEAEIDRLIRDEKAKMPGVQVARRWLVVEAP